MRPRALVYLAIFVFVLASATFAGASVNKSIRVDDGETADHELNSVNGSITVGSRAELQRSAETVNGGITVGDDSRTRDLISVNGRVRVGDRVSVDGNLRSVNGAVEAGEETVVTGRVETVNGGIDLRGTTVQDDLQTVNGRVRLDRGSRILGDLVIEGRNNHGWSSHSKPLVIELRDGSVIEGDIDVRDEDRRVTVRLSGGSSVKGQVRGAEVVRE